MAAPLRSGLVGAATVSWSLLDAVRKQAAEISHSTVKTPLNSKALDGPPSMLALDGAVAMSPPSDACMIAMPSMVRAMPADWNQAANPPTAAAMISMK